MSTEIHDRNTEQLEKVRQALRDYYYALDCREHGGIAGAQLVTKIQLALEMGWNPGAEKLKREDNPTDQPYGVGYGR